MISMTAAMFFPEVDASLVDVASLWWPKMELRWHISIFIVLMLKLLTEISV